MIAMVLTEACASAPGHQPAHIAQTQDLVGRTLDIDYGSRRYELRFIDANTIHWRCVAGDELGAEATEKVVVQATGDGLFHLNWVERSGLGVSELLDTLSLIHI